MEMLNDAFGSGGSWHKVVRNLGALPRGSKSGGAVGIHGSHILYLMGLAGMTLMIFTGWNGLHDSHLLYWIESNATA